MNAELEERVRAWHAAGDLDAIAEAAFREYGPPIYRYLVQRMRGPDGADEVFGQLGEDVWRGLPRFSFRASLWTWMHTLARNAARRHEQRPAHQARRHVGESHLDGVVQQVRSQTRPYLRTEVKDRFTALQDALDEEERELLLLRVHQKLSWNDVATVLADGDGLPADALAKESARLRQRFQKVKRRLRELAEAEGLID